MTTGRRRRFGIVAPAWPVDRARSSREGDLLMSSNMDRRSWVGSVLGAGALYGLDGAFTAQPTAAAQVGARDRVKVRKIETFVLTNSWVFVKISTDAGIVGWGEMLKDDAKACAAGAMEVGDYLIGQDPTRVVHHWRSEEHTSELQSQSKLVCRLLLEEKK